MQDVSGVLSGTQDMSRARCVTKDVSGVLCVTQDLSCFLMQDDVLSVTKDVRTKGS